VVAPADRFIGHPMLILVPDSDATALAERLAPMFNQIAVVQPLPLRFGGYTLLTISVLKGEGFRGLSVGSARQ
jgi:hypothetical protein